MFIITIRDVWTNEGIEVFHSPILGHILWRTVRMIVIWPQAHPAQIQDLRSQIPGARTKSTANGLQLVVFISVLVINQSASSQQLRSLCSSHVALASTSVCPLEILLFPSSPSQTASNLLAPLASISFTLHAHKRRLTARQYFKINPTASDDEVWLTFQPSRVFV